MNEKIKQLARQAGLDLIHGNFMTAPQEKFAELIIQECNAAVLSVPCYYKDYRSQIEEAVINDCGRAVLEHFEIKS
jgi:hypothetical protein